MRLISVFCRWHTRRRWNQLPSNTTVLTPSMANNLIGIHIAYFLYCKPRYRYLNRLYRMYSVTSLFFRYSWMQCHTLYADLPTTTWDQSYRDGEKCRACHYHMSRGCATKIRACFALRALTFFISLRQRENSLPTEDSSAQGTLSF
jgi:hypothetical protein